MLTPACPDGRFVAPMKLVRCTRAAAIAAAATLALSSPAAAQEPLRLSIEAALERAAKTSEDIGIARAGVTRAEEQRRNARAAYLPQLSGTLSYERTLASEFDAIDIPGFGDMQPAEGDEDGGLPFGRPNTWRIGLNASQTLYAGGRISALNDSADASVESARIGLGTARAQAVFETAQAYYDAVLSAQLARIAEAALKQAEDTREHTKLGRELGTVPEFDLLRAEVTVGNQRPIVVQRRVEARLAIERLRLLLDLPRDQPLELTSSLEPEGMVSIAPAATSAAGLEARSSTAGRSGLQQLEALVRIREASVDVVRAGHYPSVSLATNFGPVNYNLFPEFDDWRLNWTVGVYVNIPIFAGFAVAAEVAAAEATLIETRAQLEKLEEQSALDTRTAREQLDAARANWEATAGGVEQGKRAYEIAEIRYRQGISTQIELADARLLLAQAEANRARAARDLQVAQARIALLPVLPIGSALMSGASSFAGQ